MSVAVRIYEFLNFLCIPETLRMHPPVPALNRQCSKDYNIPGTDVIIEKGTPVLISTLGLQYDADLFPDPDLFNPDRYGSKENIPGFLGFGAGPRYCIGTS